MTITYPIIDDTVILNLTDDKITEALAYLRATNYDADGPASPVDGQLWIKSTNDELAVYLSGWIPFRGFGPGKPVIWCDDQPEEIRLLAPDTGIVAGGYNMVLPTGAGSASQAWRVASVDGNTLTMEWFTPTASSLALDGLTDVFTGTPVDTTIYGFQWVAGNSRYELVEVTGGGSSSLGGLTDTDLDSPGVGEFLRHDGANWVNTPLVLGDIPDLSSLYAAASHTHSLSALTASGATAGKFPRWNGAQWVPVSIAAGDLPAAYLPIAGGTLTGLVTADAELRLGHTGSLVFETADEANKITIVGPAELEDDLTITLPANNITTAAEFVPTGFPTITDIGGLAFLAVNQTTGEAVWIGIEGGSGGKALLNGATNPNGHTGEIRQPGLTRPYISDFQNANHSHDGSTGEFFIPGGPYDGDGSNTLDLFYAIDLTGGPLVPQVGGTGRSSISAGALLLGGASSTTIPDKDLVESAANNGAVYTPMIELLGDTDGAAVVWDDDNNRWAQGPVIPTSIDDLIATVTPPTGGLVHWDGDSWESGLTLPALVRFASNLEVGGGASSVLPGSIRLIEGGLIGSDSITITAPGNISTSYVLQLPASGGLAGDTLINNGGSPNFCTWGSVSKVAGVAFLVGAADVGDLIVHDGNDFVRLSPGLEDQVLTVTAGGDIEYAYAPGRTFSIVRSLGGIEGAVTVAALPYAPQDMTLTLTSVYTAGTSPTVTYQILIDGVDAYPSNRTASGDGNTSNEPITVAVSQGDQIEIAVQSVSGSVSEATFQLQFRK